MRLRTITRAARHARSASEAQKVLVGKKPVEAGIGLTSLTHEASESNEIILSGHLALLIALLTNKRDALKIKFIKIKFII